MDSAGADRAVRAAVNSSGEGIAYAALGSAFNNCVAEGNTIRFSRSLLEAILSEALYRRVTGLAPTNAAAGAK